MTHPWLVVLGALILGFYLGYQAGFFTARHDDGDSTDG